MPGPAWFYSRDGRAELSPDGACPEGWADTPAAFEGATPAHNGGAAAESAPRHPAPEAAPVEPAVDSESTRPRPAPRDPLDHDGDGRKGGSLPKAKRGRPAKAAS